MRTSGTEEDKMNNDVIDVTQWLEDYENMSTELEPSTYRRLFFEAYAIVYALVREMEAQNV